MATNSFPVPSDLQLEKRYTIYTIFNQSAHVTPDFFYVFNLILSFSTCSQSFKKICAWELLGANVLKEARKGF